MAKKFELPSHSLKISRTVRFPETMIDEVEEAIRGTNVTFSAFVVAAVRAALDSLKEGWAT